MNTKGFILLIVAVLVLGATIGGSFIGGLTVGKNQEAEAAPSNLPAQPSTTVGPQTSGLTDGQTLADLRERVQSGEIDQDDLAQLREQFQGRLGQGPGGGGFGRFAGGGGLTGTIEKVEGNTVTVNTPQGSLQATVGPETTIQKTTEISLEDLIEGMRLTVSGEPGEDGAVQATTIFVFPEGAGGFGGGGFGGGAGQHGGGFGGGR